jgi:hypothetical protein
MATKGSTRSTTTRQRPRQEAHVFVHRTEDRYVVVPGTFIAYRIHAPHRLRNLTSDPLTVTFPTAKIGPFPVAPNGTVELTGLDALPAGIYDYQVEARFGRKLRFVAIGNSPPRAIVDP